MSDEPREQNIRELWNMPLYFVLCRDADEQRVTEAVLVEVARLEAEERESPVRERIASATWEASDGHDATRVRVDFTGKPERARGWATAALTHTIALAIREAMRLKARGAS